MSTGSQDLSHDDLNAMSYEDIQAIARGLGQPQAAAAPAAQAQEQAEAPQQEAQETPAEQAQEAAAGTEAPAPDPAARQGDPNVPLSHAREQARQAQAERDRIAAEKAALEAQHRETERQAREAHAQLQKLHEQLRNPEVVRQHLQAIAPAEQPDFDVDPHAAVAHIVAPLQQQIQNLTAKLQHQEAQAKHHAYLGQLAAKHGGDFHQTLADFDQTHPNLAQQGMDPEIRYLTALGLKAKQATPPDPAAEQARIQAEAQKQAEQMVAQALAGGKAPKGITTLGDAPQNRQDQAPPDLGSLDYDQMSRMSSAEQQALLKRHYGATG